MLQCLSFKPSVCMFCCTCHEACFVTSSCSTQSTLCCASFARPLLVDTMSSTKRWVRARCDELSDVRAAQQQEADDLWRQWSAVRRAMLGTECEVDRLTGRTPPKGRPLEENDLAGSTSASSSSTGHPDQTCLAPKRARLAVVRDVGVQTD